MPALLSEVFKETSFTVNDGQIKAHYGKPATQDTSAAVAAPATSGTSGTSGTSATSGTAPFPKIENSEKEQWEQRIVTLIKQNNQLQEQIKAMQQKMETIMQQGGTRFDIMAFAEQNPVITIIIILVGIDLFRKAFLK
jgi:flagellar capping protein FliD